VKQLLTSVVREICTLRSVGAGAGDRPGHPVATSDGRPYRDKIRIFRVTARPNSVDEETSLRIRDVVKEYQHRLARHREEMLKKIQEEDDSAEF
jgi:hypothetical protein